jgi:hypothetical protein
MVVEAAMVPVKSPWMTLRVATACTVVQKAYSIMITPPAIMALRIINFFPHRSAAIPQKGDTTAKLKAGAEAMIPVHIRRDSASRTPSSWI